MALNFNKSFINDWLLGPMEGCSPMVKLYPSLVEHVELWNDYKSMGKMFYLRCHSGLALEGSVPYALLGDQGAAFSKHFPDPEAFVAHMLTMAGQVIKHPQNVIDGPVLLLGGPRNGELVTVKEGDGPVAFHSSSLPVSFADQWNSAADTTTFTVETYHYQKLAVYFDEADWFDHSIFRVLVHSSVPSDGVSSLMDNVLLEFPEARLAPRYYQYWFYRLRKGMV